MLGFRTASATSEGTASAKSEGALESLWAIKSCVGSLKIRLFENLFTAKAYDASSEAFQALLDYVVADSLARELLLSLMRCCSSLDTSPSDADPVLELLFGFGKQLERFVHLGLWKAYMLMLLVKTALLPDCSRARLISLRNSIGPCTTTVPLDGVPRDCLPLVDCGRSLLVSMDVKDGAPLSGMGLKDVFEMAGTLMDLGSLSLIRGAFDILQPALYRDGLPYTSECYDSTLKLVKLVFRFKEAGCPGGDKLGGDAMLVWGKVGSFFSFDEAIMAADSLIAEHARCKELWLLLTIPTTYVSHRWPLEKQGHESSFNRLRDIMLLLSRLALYPGPDEASRVFLQSCSNRGVYQQLRMVASTVYLYLCIMLKDVETNYTGLFGREGLEKGHAWVSGLHKEATEVPGGGITGDCALAYVEYAIMATKDPQFIKENGLPFKL